MIDMSETIKPKSNQLNADDLMAGPMTIKITDVQKHSSEQPIAIYYGDPKKPYLPCKTVRRLMVLVWGDDGSKYVGNSLTLYRDATVTWGGQEVGGIRVSHMTGLTEKKSFALTASNKSKKPWVILPLGDERPAKIIDIDALNAEAATASMLGSEMLKSWFLKLSNEEKLAIKPFMDAHKEAAEKNNQPKDGGVL